MKKESIRAKTRPVTDNRTGKSAKPKPVKARLHALSAIARHKPRDGWRYRRWLLYDITKILVTLLVLELRSVVPIYNGSERLY